MEGSPRVRVPSEYVEYFCAVMKDRAGLKIFTTPSAKKTTLVRIPRHLLLEAYLAIAEINVEIAI